MSKTILIIGKGLSVLKSTKKFVDSFDEVAICNFPPMRSYEQYVGNKADFHFLNAHDPNPYDRELLDSLGLKKIFNTHYKPHPGRLDIFPDHEVVYVGDYGEKKVVEFKDMYGFDPSTGIMAFEYFVNKKIYDTIGLVGFDFFEVGNKAYYYPVDEVQQSLKYLYSDGQTAYTLDGVRKLPSPHDSEESKLFVEKMALKNNKKIIYPFKQK